MAPYKIEAKAVNGGNLSLGNQGCLKPQMLILRVLLKLFFHRLPNSLTHLRSSRIGEGHYQKLVNIQGMISLAYHSNDTFHQYGRLSAASCCRYQKISVSALNHLKLPLSPCHCHLSHLPFPDRSPPRFPPASSPLICDSHSRLFWNQSRILHGKDRNRRLSGFPAYKA